jgi:uncharacterized protein (TIGR02145 family)
MQREGYCTVLLGLPVNIGITIVVPATNVCTGIPVTFTAIATNGGASPAYQWRVNATNANNATNSSYTYTPVNGDVVTCLMTSSEACVTGNPATINAITMTVTAGLPAGISIAASANPFCEGTAVTFSATAVNGGATPGYQWRVNAWNASNATNASYTYVPANGDAVQCVLTSALSCVTGSPAASNTIVMAASPKPNVIFTPCNDLVTTLNAQPFVLKGGIPPGGVYSGPGVNPATGLFTPAAAGTGVKTIHYTYTNAAACSDDKNLAITVQTAPAFACGNLLTDVRDGKQYKTFPLSNGHCWMQENLRYGVSIPETNPQTDNCLDEHYLRTSSLVLRTSSPAYQWDELMHYAPAFGVQGLCPPGWHVPTSGEWEELVNFFSGPGLAGGPMKDSLVAGGFRSYQEGFYYLNNLWAFTTGSYAGSMYWTSTPSGTGRAEARGLNTHNMGVSRYQSSRGNAFPVRCCKD